MSSNFPQTDKDTAALLSAYVDQEANASERNWVEHRMASDPSIEAAVNAERLFKSFIGERCKPKSAPDSLRTSIDDLLTETSVTPVRAFSNRVYWAAAAVVLFSAMLYVYQIVVLPSTFDVEKYAWLHFDNGMNSVEFLPISETNPAAAHGYLKDHMGMDVTVPTLAGARFMGVKQLEFVPGHDAPVLTYAAANDTDLIHIFVFKVDQLTENATLQRDEDAIALCSNNPDAVYVADINGKHVVSWQWQDTWYTAVSHHSGDVIAGMLPIKRNAVTL